MGVCVWQHRAMPVPPDFLAAGGFLSEYRGKDFTGQQSSIVFFAISSLIVLGSMSAKMANSAKTGISFSVCLICMITLNNSAVAAFRTRFCHICMITLNNSPAGTWNSGRAVRQQDGPHEGG